MSVRCRDLDELYSSSLFYSTIYRVPPFKAVLKMSDDECEVVYMRRTTSNVVHYGSLEDQERKRLQNVSSSKSMATDAIQAGISAGHINVTSGMKFIPIVSIFYLM